MTRSFLITPKASQDLDDLFDYIAQNHPDAALRFFDATRQTIARLVQNPGLGSPYPSNNPRLANLRKWGVQGFEKYLIFYLRQDELVKVVRIIHAARDLPTLLEQEG